MRRLLKRLFPCEGSCSGKKVLFIITLFVAISIVLLVIFYLQGRVFEGVRSYVRGEGLWAKAQQNAVNSLTRYSYSREEQELASFYKKIEVNLGDKEARLSLSLPDPDRKRAFDGFLIGMNDPRDIDSMIWFFLNFQSVYYLKEAIRIWTEADGKIEALIGLAGRMNRSVLDGDGERTERIRKELIELDRQLIVLENQFSAVLGDGARWVKQTIWYATLAILFLFVSIAVWVSRQIIKGIEASELKLRISDMRFISLFESNTIGIISWHLDGTIDDANGYFLNMLGYHHSDLKNRRLNWKQLTPPSEEQRDQQAVYELLTYGRCTPYEKLLLNKQGKTVPIYLGASFIDTYRDRGMAYIIDLRERKRQEAQQRLSAAVFNVSRDGILITDADFNIVSANKAMERLSGLNSQELKGDARAIFQSASIEQEVYDGIYSSLASAGYWQGDIAIRSKTVRILPVHVSVDIVTDGEGNPTNFVAVFSDITERKVKEERLNHMAHHDPLTGLSNRTYLEQRIKEAIEHTQNEDTLFALLFFDLDRFKPVNDTYGHEVGDVILKTVAERLKEHVRSNDTVARIGGDEFVILLEGITEKEMAQRIATKTLESVGRPYLVDSHMIDVGISVGISLFPENGQTAEVLLHHADTAMYAMKGVVH